MGAPGVCLELARSRSGTRGGARSGARRTAPGRTQRDTELGTKQAQGGTQSGLHGVVARSGTGTGPGRDRASPGTSGCQRALPARLSQSGRAFRRKRPSQPIRMRIQDDAAISANQNADSGGCRLSQSERGGPRLQSPQPIRTRGLLSWSLCVLPLPSPPSSRPTEARTDPSLPALDVPRRSRRPRGAVSMRPG